MPDKPKQQRTHDDPKQSKRFIEAAKKAEASKNEKEADRAFKKIARPKAPSQRDSIR